MAETHVISALVEKRARVSGAVNVRRYQIMRLEIELAQLDAVIRSYFNIALSAKASSP